MHVSSSGYYEWVSSSKTKIEAENEELTAIIKNIFVEGRSVYGARRIVKYLAQQDIFVSRRRVRKLMTTAGLSCKTKRKFKATTDSNHASPIAPNLLKRKFEIDRANQYWVGDITYIPTKEGWLYLAVVIDLCSRKIVGWSMSNRINSFLVNNALLMAIWKRKPAKGLMWHTDRGSQYASISHRAILQEHNIIQSMSRKGNCWDNAVSESFFGTIKTELTNNYNFKNREEAKKVIFEYIEIFYNQVRIHSANNYLSPDEYERVQNVA